MTDCEEAMTSFDKIVATCSPGKNLTAMEKNAISQILGMLVSRVNMFPTPENLEDGFHRLHSYVPYSLDDEDRNRLNIIIDAFTRRRSRYFGITGNSGGTPPDPYMEIHPGFYLLGGFERETRSQIQEKLYRLHDFAIAIMNGETTDVEAAVEGNRKLIPLQKSSD